MDCIFEKAQMDDVVQSENEQSKGKKVNKLLVKIPLKKRGLS